MRKQLTQISAALAIAAAAAACDGRTHNVASDRDQTGGKRGVNQRISLRGCVQPAVTGQGYTLRHVVVDAPGEQPQGSAITDDPVVARGSWVRLEAGKDMTDDFKSYLNNEVTIIGDVVDTGQNTIGTAGHEGGSPQEQNPSTSSVANGDAPRVAVEKVQKIAENCAGE